MATEREHIERAEALAAEADRLAEMHAHLAAVRALTAEPPGTPHTPHASRPSGLPDLPVTTIGDRR